MPKTICVQHVRPKPQPVKSGCLDANKKLMQIAAK